ncbi:MAG: tetratricopeptide repeat protein, partial [Xanthomonadales bacterium]|nr:tetratricopeptide repeat protein [Xanthomonadales bacterium]
DRAQHVTQFLIDAFAAANPGGELGKDVKAKDILERSAKQLETELSDQPELKAQLLATIAEGQRALGLEQEANNSASRAVELVAGTGSEGERRARLSLASGYTRDRNIEPATAELALVREMTSGVVAEAELLLAEQELMERIGGFDRSDKLFNSFMAKRRNDLASVQIGLLSWIQINQATTLQMLQRRDEAFALAKQVFDRSGSGSVEIRIKAANKMSSALRSRGDVDAAIEVSRQAVLLSQAVYGKKHSSYVAAANTYANALMVAGRHAEAMPIRRESLRIDADIYGANSTTLFSKRHNLALDLVAVGDFEEAARIWRELMIGAATRLPDESLSYQLFSLSLAGVLYKLGQVDEALDVLDDAIEDGSRTVGNSKMDRYIQRLMALRAEMVSDQ